MKRIGRFFLRLGLRARLMLVIGILAFVLTAGSIAAFSYAIEFTEDHLVSENQMILREFNRFLRTSTTHFAAILTVISRMGKPHGCFRIRSFTQIRASSMA